MTTTAYRSSMEDLARRAREDRALAQDLRAAYAALGVRHGVSVALPVEGCPTSPTRDILRVAELRRPWVALVTRDGLPPRSWIVAGDTREAVLERIPPSRPGPNGPIDDVQWLRRPHP